MCLHVSRAVLFRGNNRYLGWADLPWLRRKGDRLSLLLVFDTEECSLTFSKVTRKQKLLFLNVATCIHLLRIHGGSTDIVATCQTSMVWIGQTGSPSPTESYPG